MTKILLDSTYFVRLLTQDVESQFNLAKDLIEQIEKDEIVGVVPVLVIEELVEILEEYYLIPREHFVPVVVKILNFRSMKVLDIKKSLLLEVLNDYLNSNLSFTQSYVKKIIGDKQLASFDKNLLKAIH